MREKKQNNTKMSDFLGSKTWTLPIGDSNGTVTIALSFIFLAYILHPAIDGAYHRLRAYRAWRAIQKRETVDVTTYPMLAEVFGGRGVWDAARIITVLLLAFSLASWGLELSMDLASLEGEADLLNRPPPVYLSATLVTDYASENNDLPWQVRDAIYYFFSGGSGFSWSLSRRRRRFALMYGGVSFSFRRAAAPTQLNSTHTRGHMALMVRIAFVASRCFAARKSMCCVVIEDGNYLRYLSVRVCPPSCYANWWPISTLSTPLRSTCVRTDGAPAAPATPCNGIGRSTSDR